MANFGGTTQRDTEVRLPRATRVRNKQPADQQITAEQILRESKELQEVDFKAPKQKISSPAELAEYRLRKRKEFEDLVRRVRWNQGVWVKYAQWEESQKDYRRARSVWERALDVSYASVTLWLKYAEMEMRARFINHARNIWDRAVTLLPRIDQLWYKYIHMEEMLNNVPGARQIFERWMQWEPDHHGWAAYIKMELRYSEVERARNIYERYVQCLPSVKAWVRYAKFEMKNGQIGLARTCYERAVGEMGEDAQTEELFIKFAEFEEKCKEPERARAIYKYALDHIPKGQAQDVYKKFVAFEKQHGDREGIEDVIVGERRFQYEAEVKKNPLNYDSWFDYIRLEEAAGDQDKIREVYERAIANTPPADEKRYWQRYIYLWINYALFEELGAQDAERTREVYRACLKLIPHKAFTFAKMWILAAQFEVRQQRLDAARKILGMSLGMCPKDRTYKAYIEIERQLGNIERVRTLYEKYLEWSPANCTAWCKFGEFEQQYLGEIDRARAIYELAIAQPILDMPEVLWKSYIDFEISEGNRENTRKLYERLLQRTKHVKVWLSYASFEATPASMLGEEEQEEDGSEAGRRQAAAEQEGPAAAADREAHTRSVYERAFRSLRENQPDAKEEAVMLLEAWRAFEADTVAAEQRQTAVEAVERKMPKKLKKKRKVQTDEGMDAGMEEYYDYVFPEEEGSASNLKFLERAQAWKRQKQMEATENGVS
ncbi:hypothetical protein WJX77_006390 [Trebouxia sp. C0004]